MQSVSRLQAATIKAATIKAATRLMYEAAARLPQRAAAQQDGTAGRSRCWV